MRDYKDLWEDKNIDIYCLSVPIGDLYDGFYRHAGKHGIVAMFFVYSKHVEVEYFNFMTITSADKILKSTGIDTYSVHVARQRWKRMVGEGYKKADTVDCFKYLLK